MSFAAMRQALTESVVWRCRRLSQTIVGLSGGMNGDAAELPDAIKAEVDELVENACWFSRG